MLTEILPIELQEGILIGIIIILQLLAFINTRRRIQAYQGIIPPENQCYVKKTMVPVDDLANKTTDTIILESKQQEPQATAELSVEEFLAKLENDSTKEEVALIQTTRRSKDPTFQKISSALNAYLIRNRTSIPDFILLKDIVERNTNAVDNDIRITLPLPLYLGLMGTMLGIVIGLFNLPDLGILTGGFGPDAADTQNFSEGINILMGGVRIAMIASFSGLLLTTFNSGVFYKGSKSLVEDKKNAFYSFLQRELLPVLSGNVTSSLATLQKKLTQFNYDFSNNLNRLGDLMTQNYDTLNVQRDILEKLERSDFSTMVKSNLSIFKEVQDSIKAIKSSSQELEQFNGYLHQVNSFVNHSAQLNQSVTAMLSRTNRVEEIANKISENLEGNNQLQQYLNSHFSELEERGNLINQTVTKVDDVLDQSLSELKGHTMSKIQEIRDFTTNEQAKIEDVLKENSENVKQFFVGLQAKMGEMVKENQATFKKLDHLEALNDKFDRFLQNQQASQKQLKEGFSKLKVISSQTKTISPTGNQEIIPKNYQFQRALNYTFQIMAILFFIATLTFLGFELF